MATRSRTARVVAEHVAEAAEEDRRDARRDESDLPRAHVAEHHRADERRAEVDDRPRARRDIEGEGFGGVE